MKVLPGIRPFVPVPLSHQGGWDEILMFLGGPIALFVILRLLGVRRERREAAEAAEAERDEPS